MPTLDDRRWRSVLTRDRTSDGRFVYGVRSTGVYCRVSCPSRRPLRRHVRFFATPDSAERAGFRPCRRCRPDGSDPQVARIRKACAAIAARHGTPVTLGTLASHVGLSPYHLQRTFKRIVGVSPREYAEALRNQAVKAHLRSGRAIADATFEAGFGSSSRLYGQANAILGMTPAQYRNGAELGVRYTTTASPLGRLLVARTDRGLCAVRLGTRDAELVTELRREFPAATIRKAPRELRPWVATLMDRMAGRPRADLPLDIQATAFQWQVWRALHDIPPGDTRTYGEVARTIGRPGAARAVGRACAANPVAVVIPCHRVTRGDGRAGGYRWGAQRKAALLATERAGQAGSRRGRPPESE